jgi:hypothetical protein
MRAVSPTAVTATVMVARGLASGPVVEIASLAVGDGAVLWAELGFAAEDDVVRVSGVAHLLDGSGHGVSAWTLRNGDGIVELPTASAPPPGAVAVDPVHPNGVIGLDHVVVETPDIARTMRALESAGVGLRRTREAGSAQRPLLQAFYRLGAVVLEVVGRATSPGDGPARFWGLAYTVADLDATATFLGPRLRPATDAVQPGRRIAALDRAAGSSVAMAFLSPAS